MSGLNASLSLATQSILAQDGALQVTNNNISNVNTPGYSRQIVTLSTSASVNNGNAVENGVVLQGYQSVRDQVIQQNLQSQTSAGSSADTQASALQLIQSSFTSSTTDIGSSMSTLFASISNLSTNPADPAARQAVLSAAGTLTTSFHQASASLTQVASNANDQVTQNVAQINQLTGQIAQVSKQISQVAPNGGNTGSLEDQREQLVLQLSKLTNVSETTTENGVTLTTGNGVPLVVAGQSYSLQTKNGTDGYTHVLSSSGQDITSSLSGGSLGGSLQLRDGTAAGLLNQLDTLANQFATAMNTAQSQGYDSKGAAGTNLFTVPGTVGGSAKAINVAISDPSGIAASSDGSSASNGNVASLLGVQTAALPSGKSPVSGYADLVFNVGNAASVANANSSATKLSIQQLTDARSSVSGVSVDEESANLIRYQQAYQASARVISTINTLYSAVLNMGTGGSF